MYEKKEKACQTHKQGLRLLHLSEGAEHGPLIK